MNSHNENNTTNSATFSIPSLIAVAAAILSFVSGATLGLLFALLAMVFGILGIVIALSPRRRGGVSSALAIIGGLLGVIAAVIKAIAWFF